MNLPTITEILLVNDFTFNDFNNEVTVFCTNDVDETEKEYQLYINDLTDDVYEWEDIYQMLVKQEGYEAIMEQCQTAIEDNQENKYTKFLPHAFRMAYEGTYHKEPSHIKSAYTAFDTWADAIYTQKPN
jgi:hypothetical protein